MQTIRLIGLDTPGTSSGQVQCFGREASAYAKTLLDDQQVRIDQDSTRAPEPPAPKPEPKPDLNPHFDTCKEANAHGYGPYRRDVDAEYDWYQDRDHDGLVCER